MGKQLNLDEYIRKVSDFPKPGVLFYDITSILIRPEAFGYCVDSMVEIYRHKQIDAVAAIEARGFLFAAPFAVRMGIPLLLIRKKGKLPGRKLTKIYDLEYAQAEIEIHPDDVPQGSKVLLLDDLIATGGTLRAARELINASGGEVTNIFGVVGLPFLNFRKALGDIDIQTLIEYDSE
ncbi:MAG: adenine phosphoribosyltransferase [Treponema sp.]|jgi:adenine phosphoribosyltransferase|nr:adenine phosphoribosyltransferase [Treponema sp.]